MILVDTSIWVDHLRSSEPRLVSLLGDNTVLGHPHVAGELALGALKQRDAVLKSLLGLPQAVVARDPEVMALIESAGLHGVGIGYVDAHLLAACRLTPRARLWTRDKRLGAVAARLGLGAGDILR